MTILLVLVLVLVLVLAWLVSNVAFVLTLRRSARARERDPGSATDAAFGA